MPPVTSAGGAHRYVCALPVFRRHVVNASPTRRLAVLITALLGCLLLMAASARPAEASSRQESIMQDDPKVVFASSDPELDRVFRVMRSLGVDRVRISVFWHLVAPSSRSRRRPWFGPRGPTWPGSYPAEGWRRYDRIVRLARKHRLGLLFTIVGPAPAWAARTRRRRESVWRPSSRDFRNFVTAVGRRYSGSWGRSDPLPRVTHWSIWNEPNFPGWLSPQRVYLGKRIIPISPRIYRGLLDAGWSGLRRSGHGRDRILIGETAPRGAGPYSRRLNNTILPLSFIRHLYCLNDSYEPFYGRSARARGCPPTRRARRSFVRRHPGLFRTRGFAHHPYNLNFRPTHNFRFQASASLAGLGRLTRTLDRVYRRWRVRRRLPIYITEYGYQTRPDPFVGISFRRQAAWTSWAEEIAYRNRRVASFAQFLLVDDKPMRSRRRRRRWATWQSGLLTAGFRLKPLFYEYQRPIRVSPTRVRRGRRVRVFGGLRPPQAGTRIRARIQFRRPGEDFRTLHTTVVRNVRGYLSRRVVVPATGDIRILWTDPATGDPLESRSVRVALR